MNIRKSVATALAATSLVVVPAAAQAQTSQAAASKLSVRAAPAVREGANVKKSSDLVFTTPIIVAIVVVTAVTIAAVAGAFDGDSSPS